MYATGDLAIYEPDFGFIFRGRIDEQIKLRGVRIELGGVEAAFIQATGGQQAAAIVYPINYPTKLVVYLEKGEAIVTEVFKTCCDLLQHYEQPDEIIEIERLPRTQNGKLDRKALVSLYQQQAEEAVISISSIEQHSLLTATDIENTVRTILSQRYPSSEITTSDVKPYTDILEYVDSLEFIDIIIAIEQQFTVTIQDWEAVTRLDKLVDIIPKFRTCSKIIEPFEKSTEMR
jgi:acyl carrier protein